MSSQSEIGRPNLKASSALVIDGDRSRRQRLVTELGRHLGLAEGVSSMHRADSVLRRCRFDCIVLDLDVGAGSPLDWAARLKREHGSVAIILCCEEVDARQAVGALRLGVADILLRPFEPASLVAAVRRIGSVKTNYPGVTAVPRGDRVGSEREAILVGDSAAMADVRAAVERIATLPTAVLIEGERGTGKQELARLLHQRSGRRGAFVSVDCGALGSRSLESELFGHVKGAFTGAHQVRDGLFVAARGGTLFLKEIEGIPPGPAAGLVRALEEGVIRPVGSDKDLRVDVRVVASTTANLAELVRGSSFRDDLYYKLDVVRLRLPPLRERAEDIEDLAGLFMEHLAADLGMAPMPLNSAQLDDLRGYSWPGNVRELGHVVEKILMLGEMPADGLVGSVVEVPRGSVGYPDDWTLDQVKDHHMRRVLAVCGGNRSEAARRLGVSRKTLERRLGPRGEH